MKKIIVPLDFSDDSVNALDFAVSVAKKTDTEIMMINVIKTSRFDFFKGVENVATKGDFETLISKYGDFKDKIQYKIRRGKVYREIVEQAIEDKAFLIIMGSHGVSGFEEVWIGSNTFRVVSEAPCPVITLRKEFQKRSIDKIVLPIDTTFESRQKIPMTVEIAKLFDAEIHVRGVCINEVENELVKVKKYVAQTREVIEKQGVSKIVESVAEGKNKSKMSLEYANQIGADLVSIMTEQEEDFSLNLMGSYAQYMVHHSNVPILACHPREDLVVKTFLR
jgi:nucleotide-binding universal stress UspA family protein